MQGEQAAAEESVDALRKLATGLAKEATKDVDGAVAEPVADRAVLRVIEAKLFASDKALTAKQLSESLPEDVEVQPLLEQLQAEYQDRGVNLVRVAGRWSFRTAEDLAYLMEREVVEERRLSRAALETLAIIAYHQPTTRAEIEEVRGVSISKGTLDTLMEVGWVRPRGRRRAPGKPLTYGTTEEFLLHFGLDTLSELPGLGELKGAGLLDAALPPDFRVPQPKELAALMPDELPLEDEEHEGSDPEFDLDEPDDREADHQDDEDQDAGTEAHLPSEKQTD
ncbi:MAG: SMC-Scp complex subunit ScpB [Pseudomonadota bacterium]